MKYYTVSDIIEELKKEGITENSVGEAISRSQVHYFKEKLGIKPVNKQKSYRGRGNKQKFAQEDAYKIMQEIILNSTENKSEPEVTERKNLNGDMVSFTDIAKKIAKNKGRTRNGKKVTAKHIYDYIRIRPEWKNIKKIKIHKKTYIAPGIANEIIEHYSPTSPTPIKVIKLKKETKDIQIATLKEENVNLKLEVEHYAKYANNLKEEKNKYQQLYQELQNWKDNLDEHRFLFWKYWR